MISNLEHFATKYYLSDNLKKTYINIAKNYKKHLKMRIRIRGLKIIRLRIHNIVDGSPYNTSDFLGTTRMKIGTQYIGQTVVHLVEPVVDGSAAGDGAGNMILNFLHSNNCCLSAGSVAGPYYENVDPDPALGKMRIRTRPSRKSGPDLKDRNFSQYLTIKIAEKLNYSVFFCLFMF